MYPRTYDPSFAISFCVLAILFASTFAFIFPLIAPAAVILLLLTLIGETFQITPLMIANYCSFFLFSSSFSCWLCLCSYPFSNRRLTSDLVFTTVWDCALVSTHPSWSHLLDSAILDRRRCSHWDRVVCHCVCGGIHKLEN